MSNRFLPSRRRTPAFTLVEMMVVIAIIALLASLSIPGLQHAILKARSLKCGQNLRLIGVAAVLSATDNNNRYPQIDQAATPIYTPQGPSITTALGPYGVTTNVVQCPVDISATPSSFTTYGSSYEWDPIFDTQPINDAYAYVRPTVAVPVSSARVVLALDFSNIHNGRPNVVFGDGHVLTH